MSSAGDLTDFAAWLLRQKIAKERGVRDIVSRLRRTTNFVDVRGRKSAEALIFEMGQQPKFKQLTVTVRSQLRRAVTLYKQFQTSK